MPRSKVSDEKRDEIVALRQKKAKWTEIQRLTNVDRRAAKNTYENWERNSSLEELQKVRKEVAASEFQTHMESITRLAESLASNLGVLPRYVDDMSRDSEEFLKWFFEQDLLHRYGSSKPQLDDNATGETQDFRTRDPRIYLDEKSLLYKSLRDHTRREVEWNILDIDWKNARNGCIRSASQLQKDTRKMVDDTLKNANDSGFLEKVKRAADEAEPAKKLTWAIANAIWRLATTDKVKEEPLFKAVKKKFSVETVVEFTDGISEPFLQMMGADGPYLAERITTQCNSVIILLREREVVRDLIVEVDSIRRASDTIREKLNPLMLRPLILRTRCDLCPA